MRFHFKAGLYIIFLGMTCFGCGSTKDQPDHVDIKAETIIESIITRMPGNIFVKDSSLIMVDPFSNEGFIRIYNISSGIEIAKAGKLGQGPEEFVTPGGSQIYEDQLIIFDPNLNRVGYYNIDSIMNSKKSLIQIKEKEDYQDLMTFIKIDDDLSMGVHYGSKPFKMMNTATGSMEEFGKYPIDEEINNTVDVFQASVKYHAERELIACAFFSARHITLYKRDGNIFELQWEKEFLEPEFSIANNNLKWNKDQLRGFSDICFTKDYIVALVKEEMKVSERGIDIKYVPKTLYILDYQGNFLKKYHLDIPVIRLATNLRSNTIYAIGMNPDFCLIKYNLE